MRDLSVGIDMMHETFSQFHLTSDEEQVTKMLEMGWRLVFSPEPEMTQGTKLSNIWLLVN